MVGNLLCVCVYSSLCASVLSKFKPIIYQLLFFCAWKFQCLYEVDAGDSLLIISIVIMTCHSAAKPGQASYIKEELERVGPDQAGKLEKYP